MAEGEKQELLIIKRVRGGRHEPHGGAWKIAFADFMTAMMALFLVLWLINATNQRTKASLARYFNPVDLVDMSTLKRGIRDPDKGPATDGRANGAAYPHSVTDAAMTNGAQAGQGTGAGGPRDVRSEDIGTRTAEPPPTYSEEALFRDPYAVLAQIAALGTSGEAAANTQFNQAADSDGATPDSYTDPFRAGTLNEHPNVPVRPVAIGSASPIAKPSGNPPSPRASAAKPAGQLHDTNNAGAAPATVGKSASDKAAVLEGATNQVAAVHTIVPAANPPSAAAAPSSDVLVRKLQEQFAELTGAGRKGDANPAVEVKGTGDGVLISLTDKNNFAMFAVGSAQPQPKTLHVMERIARVLKKLKGDIIIGGFTDARPYKSRVYDNWRLSTDRAQMAYYMLVRGGIDKRRIVRIEGYADRKLKVPGNPLAAANRRIEIFLKEKS